MKKNLFITIEGIEGVGKSTAMKTVQAFFSKKNPSCLITREPGGTQVGEKIRQILLTDDDVISPDTELLLMFAARAQHVQQVILPALKAGKTVISDRFTDASFAYQGGGRGIEMSAIAWLADFVQSSLTPDLTILLDAPVSVGLSRMKARHHPDRIEKEAVDFFERVRAAYLFLANQSDRYIVIDASQHVDDVQLDIQQVLTKHFNIQ